MRLKSKRPKQEEEGGAGVEGEFFGVLPHSEWSRVPESRLSVYFRRHGPLHYPYHLSYVLCISHLSYNARTRRHVCRTQWINAVASRRRHSVLEYSADTNVCPRNSLQSLLQKKKKDKVGENRTNAMLHRGTISSGRPIIINDKIWRMRREKKVQNFF